MSDNHYSFALQSMANAAQSAVIEMAAENSWEVRVDFTMAEQFGLPQQDGVTYQMAAGAALSKGSAIPEFSISRSVDGGPYEVLATGIDIDVALKNAAKALELDQAAGMSPV